jgi:hypothetical protein
MEGDMSLFRNRYRTPEIVGTSVWPFTLLFAMPVALGALAVTYPWAAPHTLLNDPYEISYDGPLHPLMGSLSTMGGYLLLGTAAITLFGATLTRHTFARWFLIAAGLYSSLLSNDELFGLHDVILPHDLLIRERYAKLFYMLAQFLYLGIFYKLILLLRYKVLLASLLAFAVSWGFDSPNVLPLIQMIAERFAYEVPTGSSIEVGWEDIPKLIGIVLWLCFHALSTRTIIANSLASSNR